MIQKVLSITSFRYSYWCHKFHSFRNARSRFSRPTSRLTNSFLLVCKSVFSRIYKDAGHSPWRWRVGRTREAVAGTSAQTRHERVGPGLLPVDLGVRRGFLRAHHTTAQHRRVGAPRTPRVAWRYVIDSLAMDLFIQQIIQCFNMKTCIVIV